MLFSNCFYINLDERKDRREHVEMQLNWMGITGERFSAVKTKFGAIGCTMSHIKCLEMAKERDYDMVFICEDDIQFISKDTLQNSVNKFMETVKEWDVCIIGGNNGRPFKPVNEICVQVQNCQTTTGYVVKKHYYDVLLKNFRESVQNLIRSQNIRLHALDIYWKQLQGRDKWFLLIPIMAYQKEGYSDIEKKNVDYRRMMANYDK
jgi:hypothetical protein